MNTLYAFTTVLAQSLAWALLYSLWQGLLVYLALYVLLKAIGEAGARLKYNLSYGAFSAAAVWFAATWVWQYQKLSDGALTAIDTAYNTLNYVSGGSGTTTASALHAGPVSVLREILPFFQQWIPAILIVYTIGVSFMLTRFIVNLYQVRKLGNSGLMPADDHLADIIATWRARFGINREVRLFFSINIDVPMMLGTIKPIILLPFTAATYLSAEQVEAILLHELAHIRRNDYLLNVLQTVAETILFFNPFIWLMSGIIRREREHCCDDMVVAAAINPLPYARALTLLEGYRANEKTLAMAATGNKNQLFHRIKRIMEMKNNKVNYSRTTIAIVGIAALFFCTVMFVFTPSFAQKVKGNDSDTTTATKKSVYRYKTVIADSTGNKIVTSRVVGNDDDHEQDDDNIDINISRSNNTPGASRVRVRKYHSGDSSAFSDIIKEVMLATKDAAKGMAEASTEMSKVDWDEIRAEIDRGMSEVDKAFSDSKFRKEISIQVKKELEQSKEAMEEAKKEIKRSQRVVAIANANGTNADSKDFEGMLDKMQDDGLIDREQSYTVKKMEGELYINGKRQPDKVLGKYKRYFSDETVIIKGHKGSLNISVDN